MKIVKTAALAAMASAAFLGAAGAQTLSMGTNPQGSLAYATGSAVSKVAIEQGDIRMRVVPQGGPNVVIPLVNNGELEFSIANGVVAAMAYRGENAEFRRANENIRVAAVLFDLHNGFMVRADSDIHTIADLKGRRAATGYLKQTILGTNSSAVLATAGLSYDDLKGVPVPNGVRGVEDFEAGAVDTTWFSISAGRVRQADAAVGGIRILPVPDTDENDAIIGDLVPGGWVSTVEPGPNYVGISQPTGVFTTPFVILTGSSVPDDTVYDLVRALHDNKAALEASSGSFSGFDPAAMNTDIGVPFHPGALKYFAETGM